MPVPASTQWLTTYYFVRAGVAVAWVAAAVTVGRSVFPVAAALLVAYPAWDAAANLVDAQRSGGWRANPSQIVNAAISTVTALAVAVSLGLSPHAVLAVFGVWAVLSGMLQLATGIRRWNGGAQWAMVLSGAQSSLAGLFFLAKANDVATPGIMDVAPYAGFGAFYFLVSGRVAGGGTGAASLGGGHSVISGSAIMAGFHAPPSSHHGRDAALWMCGLEISGIETEGDGVIVEEEATRT